MVWQAMMDVSSGKSLALPKGFSNQADTPTLPMSTGGPNNSLKIAKPFSDGAGLERTISGTQTLLTSFESR